MSLINKLLQDLEQRQAGDANSVPISTGVQPVRRAPRRAGWMVAAMLLLPMVAAAGLWALMSKGPVPPIITLAKAPVTVAPAPAQAPTPAPAPVVAAVESKPEAAKVEIAKVEVAKAPEPVVAPAAKAPAPVVVAKAAVEAPAQPKKVAVPKPVDTPPAPKAVSTAAVEKPKAVVAQASPKPKPEPKPEPKAELNAEPKPIPDAKIAGLYPGVIKKPVNDPPAVAVAVAPSAEKPAAADRPVAKLTVAAEGQSQKTFTPRQQSDNLYKQAVRHAQQGQGKDARELLAKSLEASPQNVAARQLLAGLLVEANKLPEALTLLRDGVKISPDQSTMWMNLARLQLEFGDTDAATATLEQGLGAASEDAQYHAFYAALMQRAGRHDAALKHFLVALRSDPSMPNWLVGAGISMQALGRDTDAVEAFQRAKDGGQLPAVFTSFVDQRLAQLKR